VFKEAWIFEKNVLWTFKWLERSGYRVSRMPAPYEKKEVVDIQMDDLRVWLGLG